MLKRIQAYLNQAGLSAFMGGDNATGMAAKAAVLAGGAAAHQR